jgi:Sulfatase
MDSRGDTAADPSTRSAVGASASRLGRVLQLFAVTSFAVSQPILSSMREGAGFFVNRGFPRDDIVWFVVLLAILPGVVSSALWGVAASIHPRVGRLAFSSLIGASAGLIVFVPMVRLVPEWRPAVVALSFLIGLGAIWAWNRFRSLETFLVYLGAAPLVFVLQFLLTKPIRPLLWTTPDRVSEVKVDATAPVVFVMLDEFPLSSMLDDSGQIDGDRFPNFERLAGDSTWYRHAVAADAETLSSVPAVLSGRLGEPFALPILPNYPGNLFTLFGGSYRLSVSEPFTRLCPLQYCASEHEQRAEESGGLVGLMEAARTLYWMMLDFDPDTAAAVSDPFGEFLDIDSESLSRDVAEQSATDQFERFADFLSTIDSKDRSLYFIHLFLPHAPFAYYPSGLKYEGGGELPGQTDEVWTDQALATVAWQRHLLQAQATDLLVGDLIDHLEEVGIYDRSLVVVTADHGIAFRLGNPRRKPTVGNLAEVGLVPLFIKAPGQTEARIEERPVSGIDVLPTLAGRLGIEIPWRVDGTDQPGERRATPGVRDKETTVEFDNIASALSDSIDERLMRLGPSRSDLFPFAGGRYVDLVGDRPQSSVERVPAISGWIERQDRFGRVVPESGYVPGLIHGGITGEPGDGANVAVVIDGVVAGIAPLDNSTREFELVLPERVFSRGWIEVELYLVGGPSSAPILRQVELPAPERFELINTAVGEVLVGPDGLKVRVEDQNELVGYVDSVQPAQDGVPTLDPQDATLYGWAFDTGNEVTAERIVVFINGAFAGVTDVGSPRPGLDEALGAPAARQAGFVMRISNVERQGPIVLRAFAVFDSRVIELSVLDGVTAQLRVLSS